VPTEARQQRMILAPNSYLPTWDLMAIHLEMAGYQLDDEPNLYMKNGCFNWMIPSLYMKHGCFNWIIPNLYMKNGWFFTKPF